MDWTVLYDTIGAAGVTLIVVTVVAVYLCVKNAVVLGWSGFVFHRHIAQIVANPAHIHSKKLERSGNPLIRIFSEAIRSEAADAPSRRAELAFLCHKYLSKINRGMTLLRLISVISPLLGLLGTVLGIYKVFRVIGLQSVVEPSMLANGIWEALTTTIMGLSITVPVLCFYYFYRMKIHGLQIELMEYSGRFAPLLAKEKGGRDAGR